MNKQEKSTLNVARFVYAQVMLLLEKLEAINVEVSIFEEADALYDQSKNLLQKLEKSLAEREMNNDIDT